MRLSSGFSVLRLGYFSLTAGLAFALTTAWALAWPGDNAPRSPGRHDRKIKVGKVKRRFVVYMPDKQAEKMPVVIVLHGALGNAWTAEFDSGMTGRAKKEGFIVAYPYGTGIGPKQILFWNAGSCCALASSRKVDDVSFIREMIGYLKAECGADEKRIYVAGASNGGMMAYRLATEMSGEIAAICSIEGCMFPTMARPDSAVSILAYHGTADSVIPYEGGTGHKHGVKVPGVIPVTKTMKYWVENNHCRVEPERYVRDGITKETFAGGDGDSAVCLVSIAGGHHLWPGGRAARVVGDKPSRDICASDEMLQFFIQHPKK